MIGVIKNPLLALIDDIGKVVIDGEGLASDAHLQHADRLVCRAGLAGIAMLPLNPHKVNAAFDTSNSQIHFAVGASEDKSQDKNQTNAKQNQYKQSYTNKWEADLHGLRGDPAIFQKAPGHCGEDRHKHGGQQSAAKDDCNDNPNDGIGTLVAFCLLCQQVFLLLG